MVRRVRRAGLAVYRRLRERTLIESSARMELGALELRNATKLSPARLAVSVGDLALTCGHLAAAADSWSRWLTSEAERMLTPPDGGQAHEDLSAALTRARSGLRALADHLRDGQREAGAVSGALSTLSRHDLRPPERRS